MSVLTENGGFDLRMSHLSLNLLAVFGENGGGSIGQRPRAAVVERQSNDKLNLKLQLPSSELPAVFHSGSVHVW
jgi:hypothetical protein